jgi:hypothetical protein
VVQLGAVRADNICCHVGAGAVLAGQVGGGKTLVGVALEAVTAGRAGACRRLGVGVSVSGDYKLGWVFCACLYTPKAAVARRVMQHDATTSTTYVHTGNNTRT